jgi:protein SCO1/2
MRKLIMYGAGVLVGLIILSTFAFAIFQPIKVLPRIRLAPGYSLVNQAGNTLTSEDMRGKVVLYNFTYSRCGEPCAAANETMRQVQDRLEEMDLGGVQVNLVSISVDALVDTPMVLQNYAVSLGADPSRWQFAMTTNPTILKTIVGRGFEVYYEPDDQGGYRLDPVFILVDGWGIIRGEYRFPSQTSDADRIIQHIQVLIEEIQRSVGAARLAYEAAHLFSCYAP